MKSKTFFSSLVALLYAGMILSSCEPLEPSTYTESFYRIASVRFKDGKASLLIDYTGETYYFSNFSTQADMNRFNLKDGDRVIAGMTLSAVGNITNNKLTLDAVSKFAKNAVAQSRPSDTLNYKFQFDVLNIINIQYPKIWSQGHLVNLAPTYEVSSQDKSVQFHLYPLGASNDTLTMKLFADIPDTVSSQNILYEQKLLCYDISTMRDSVSDPAENAYRDNLLTILANAGKDSITVQILAADTLRQIWNTSSGIKERKYFPIPRAAVSVSIPFDF